MRRSVTAVALGLVIVGMVGGVRALVTFLRAL
jgi:hypothetical protein